MINIYCDESCHLEHDLSSHMILGALTCPKDNSRAHSHELKNLKQKHGLSRQFELKWTKVGIGQIDYYKELIDYFSYSSDLQFRAVVADKRILRHDTFHQTHDEWYYKMYYLLLRYLLSTNEEYKIYVDIKDTRGGSKIVKLKDVLNHSLYQFYDECVKGVQQIRSDESELLQLADFLIGVIGYKNRQISTSEAKTEVVQYLSSKMTQSLTVTSPLYNTKFNVLIWQPR